MEEKGNGEEEIVIGRKILIMESKGGISIEKMIAILGGYTILIFAINI